jgi:hypothetical protein
MPWRTFCIVVLQFFGGHRSRRVRLRRRGCSCGLSPRGRLRHRLSSQPHVRSSRCRCLRHQDLDEEQHHGYRQPCRRYCALRRSTGRFSSTVASVVSWTVTCGFVVVGLASSDGRHLSDYVVNSDEVGVLRKLGNDFSRAHFLSLTCYRGDRHEALLWGSVHPIFDLVESLREIPYG